MRKWLACGAVCAVAGIAVGAMEYTRRRASCSITTTEWFGLHAANGPTSYLIREDIFSPIGWLPAFCARAQTICAFEARKGRVEEMRVRQELALHPYVEIPDAGAYAGACMAQMGWKWSRVRKYDSEHPEGF